MRCFLSITLLFLFNLVNFGFAQQTSINTTDNKILKVEKFNIQNGLSQSTVNDVLQDRDGFVWIATDDGLNRYDGQKFVIYKHTRSDSTTIPDNRVRTLYEDSTGKIWVGTINGLCFYDKNTNQFKTYRNEEGNTNSLVNNYISVILEDKNFIWIGTQKGLSKLDIKKSTFKNYLVTEKDSLVLADNKILSLLIDDQNQLWIGTISGLNVWTSDRKPKYLFRSSTLQDSKTLLNDDINSIYQDTKDRIWIGTDNGIYLYNPSSTDFQRFLLPQEKKYFVYDINETQNGEIWIGSENVIYKVDGQSIFPYSTSVSSMGEVKDIYTTKNGIIWIGTREAGLLKYTPLANRFNLYTHKEDDQNSLADPTVWTIIKDKQGTIWAGTDNAVSRITRKTDKKLDEKLDREENTTTQTDYYTISKGEKETDYRAHGGYSIIETDSGKLWFVVETGIIRMDDFSIENGGSFTSFLYDDEGSDFIETIIFYLFEDSKGTIWFTSVDGLYKFIPTPITKENKSGYILKGYLKDTNVWNIFEDSENIIWLGTSKGLVKMIRDEQNEPIDYIYYTSDIKDVTSISNNTANSVAEDSKGNLWIGTNNGLNKMNKKTGKFEYWGERNELAGYSIYGVLVDEKDNLWLSTNKGILQFLNDEESQNLEDDRRIIVYDTRDGLQSQEFNTGSFYKAEDGEMFFGGINGFNSFYPKDIKPNTEKRSVILTGLKVFGEKIKVNQKQKGRVLLPKALQNLDKLNLTYEDKIITLEFVSPNFNKPEFDTYLYKLEGFDKIWNKTKEIRQATYTNLSAGNYTFRVKVINGDNIESEETTLKISISPPFWKTWWFITLCGLVILVVSGGFYKHKLDSVKAQNVKLENLVAERTSQLQEKNDEVVAQNYSITLKNKNINASINYASRIQQAMLPPIEEMKGAFQSAFVLWLPRNVVSGDFYWFAQIEDKICIAAVDCTGHGVPGAFMSMIGNDMLNHIILEKKITNPSLILSDLHRQVSTALRQSETQNRDGMDMSLCVYDKITKELSFAGAKNPLYYIQNGELKDIAGSKFPIGGRWREGIEREYENYVLKIDQETTIFLCTDGYQDQFGGKKGKKLMKKKMKELFVEIAHLEDDKQREKLESYFLDWKKNEEQVDDVLVMGFKVG